MLCYAIVSACRRSKTMNVCIEATDCWGREGTPAPMGGTGSKQLATIDHKWLLARLHFELHVLRSTLLPSRSSQPLREAAASASQHPVRRLHDMLLEKRLSNQPSLNSTPAYSVTASYPPSAPRRDCPAVQQRCYVLGDPRLARPGAESTKTLTRPP